MAAERVATCKCGRVGRCATCCCKWRNHDVQPERPCSLCGHIGQVERVT